MTSIERTAYPQFKRLTSAVSCMCSSPRRRMRPPGRQRRAASLEALLVLDLKCFQKMVPFCSREEIGRWDAAPGLIVGQRVAVREYETAIGELGQLKAGVLAAAGQLKAVTVDALLARSGLRLRGAV